MRGSGSDFDLGRGQDRRVVARDRQQGQMDRSNSPAVVFQDAVEGGLPSTLPIRRMAAGSKSVGHLDTGLLGRVDDRLDRQVIVQRLAAATVDVADRRADLGVTVGIDVLLEEVDQAAIPLKDGQDSQVRAGRRPGEERLDTLREIRLGQDSPERLRGLARVGSKLNPRVRFRDSIAVTIEETHLAGAHC